MNSQMKGPTVGLFTELFEEGRFDIISLQWP